MRWFKHYSDNHKGKSIQFLFDNLGHFGVAGYYILLEMCAEKLERKSDESLTEAGLIFGFHQRIVRQNLRASPTNVRRMLDQCQTLGLLSYDWTQDLIEIKMPILLNLLDSDSKKPRLKRVTNAPRSRLEKEIEKEIEIEIEKNTSKPKKPKKAQAPVANSDDGKKANLFISTYCSLFKQRYHVNPEVKGKNAGIALRLSKNFNEENIIKYLNAFFNMPDSNLVKTKHPLNLFELKLNEVVVFASTGNFTTQNEARNLDQSAQTIDTLRKIREGTL